MRMCGLRRSEGEARAEPPDARDRVATEVESTIGRGRLHRADTTGVRAEEVDLRIVAAVVRPHEQVAARQCELDALTEHLAHRREVERIARRHLAELHERAVLDPVLEDALRARVE